MCIKENQRNIMYMRRIIRFYINYQFIISLKNKYANFVKPVTDSRAILIMSMICR